MPLGLCCNLDNFAQLLYEPVDMSPGESGTRLLSIVLVGDSFLELDLLPLALAVASFSAPFFALSEDDLLVVFVRRLLCSIRRCRLFSERLVTGAGPVFSRISCWDCRIRLFRFSDAVTVVDDVDPTLDPTYDPSTPLSSPDDPLLLLLSL